MVSGAVESNKLSILLLAKYKYFVFNLFIFESTPKSHPMNDFAKGLNLFNLIISQLQIHRMTKLAFFTFRSRLIFKSQILYLADFVKGSELSI